MRVALVRRSECVPKKLGSSPMPAIHWDRPDPLQKSFKLTGLLSRHREQIQHTADQAADHRPVHSYVLQVSADGRLDPVGEAAWLPAAHDSGDEADQLGSPRQRLGNNGLDGRVQPLAYRG